MIAVTGKAGGLTTKPIQRMRKKLSGMLSRKVETEVQAGCRVMPCTCRCFISSRPHTCEHAARIRQQSAHAAVRCTSCMPVQPLKPQ
jgi:hypothetical protein